jgi:uncharacterized protein (TIGR02246 family)
MATEEGQTVTHRIRSRRFSLVTLVAVGAILMLDRWGMFHAVRAEQAPQAKSGTPATDARAGDRAAVRAAMQSFVRAFNSADPKAVATHWTNEGEYIGEEGAATQGRDALQRGFAAFFKRSPRARAEIQPESLRFLSRDTAVDEGIVSIRIDGSGATTKARYSALLAREDGSWRLARLQETTVAGPSIDELAWLVGEWKSKDQDSAEVATTISWNGSKKFLHVRFIIKSADRTFDGLQLIGLDPATGGIRSWTFEAEGGVSEADWERDGDHWIFRTVGTLAAGGTLTATNILRRINENTYTLQSIDRAIDDEPLADMPPVKVTRIKPEK